MPFASHGANGSVQRFFKMTLTLLVRAYCHLCDEMREALAPLAAARGVAMALVDVDADPALEAAWGDLVPVLFAGDPAPGAQLCHYRLDPIRVEAALRAASTSPGLDADGHPSTASVDSPGRIPASGAPASQLAPSVASKAEIR